MSNVIYKGSHLPSKHLNDFDALLKAATAPVIKTRPYTVRNSRENPGLIVLLLDQSGSMSETIKMGGHERTKAEILSYTVNTFIDSLIVACGKGGEMKDYFFISVIGYGGDEDNTAKSAFEGNLKGELYASIKALAQNSTDKAWVKPTANRATPMRQALELARDTIVLWLNDAERRGKEIFPPLVLNFTDGEATDGDRDKLIKAANDIKNLATTDGNCLLFNMHLSAAEGEECVFPCTEQVVPDDVYSKTLYAMSSGLPTLWNELISGVSSSRDKSGGEAYKAFTFNAKPQNLFQYLNVGTSPSTK